MDAINHKVYNVYFGGRYHEDWSEDYTLSIHYENRRQVQARYQDGQWIPVGGDQQICALLQSPFCPKLMQDYFQASASVYAAIHECLSRGLKLERLNEVFEAKGKPLAKGNGCLSGECSSCSLSSTCGGKTLSSETEDPLVKKAVENLKAKQNTTEEVKA